ncbi:MAG: SulP family inorganic anion transporter [Rhodopila sp.]
MAAARAFTEARATHRPAKGVSWLGGCEFRRRLIGGYPVAGSLSQTAVNEKAGARSRLSLVFASATLALCLRFLTACWRTCRARHWLRWCYWQSAGSSICARSRT